jgi:hypothetical protein
MKRRWAIIFWSSIVCLVGFTLVAAKLGLQTWDLIGIHMVGMVAAGAFAFVAMLRESREKWPAVLGVIATAPMSSVALLAFLGPFSILSVLGAAGVLTFVASLCTSLATVAVALMPLPPENPRELAEARIVDEAPPRNEGT